MDEQIPVAPQPQMVVNDVPQPHRSHPLLVVLGVVTLLVVGSVGGYWFANNGKHLPSQNTNHVTYVSPTEILTQSSVPDEQTKIFSQIEDNRLSFSFINEQGVQEKFFEKSIQVAGVTAPQVYSELSPDTVTLAYTIDSGNKIFLYNLKTKQEEVYPLSESIQNFSWNLDSKSILYNSVDKPDSAQSPDQIQNHIRILDIATKRSETLKTIPGLYGFGFKKSTKNNSFYILTLGQCAPGPCYGDFYTFNTATHDIKPLINGTEVFGHRMLTFDKEGAIISGNNEMDAFSNKPVTGLISSYNISSKQITTILKKDKVAFTIVKRITPQEILYQERPIRGFNAGPSVPETFIWYIYNTDTKTSRKVFEGRLLEDIVPLNNQMGIYVFSGFQQDYEIGLIDFIHNSRKMLVRSKNSLSLSQE